MRKTKMEQLREAKRKKSSLVEMNSLDDLLKLLVDGDRPPEHRRLNPTQRAFIYSGARYKAYKGPAGCAKTSTGCAGIFARALLEPGTKYLIARQDYNDLIGTTGKRMEEMLARLPEGTLLQRNKSPPMEWYIQPAAIRMADGSINDEPSQIMFMGLKDSLGSYEYNSVFIDEAEQVDIGRIQEVSGRLRGKGTNFSVSLAFNPPDVTHPLYEACTGLDAHGKKVGEPWMELFSPEPKENVRNLRENYYEDMAKTMPEDMRIRLIDGMWGATFPGQPVYRQFRRAMHVFQNIRFHPMGTLFRLWDFGYGHPCCLWVQVTWEGHFKVLRELLGTNIEATAFAEQVKQKTQEWFPDATRIMDYGDVAVKQKKDTGQTLAALIKVGITIHSQVMGIDESMRKCRSLLERLIEGVPAFQVDARCIILIGGLAGGYHLKDDGKTPHKDGFYDHECDALRYGVVNILGNSVSSQSNLPTSVAYDPSKDQFNNR